MTEIEEIEARVRDLPSEDFARFRDWFMNSRTSSGIGRSSRIIEPGSSTRSSIRRAPNWPKVKPARFEALHIARVSGAIWETSGGHADKAYELLKANPRHPSLHLKRIDELWVVRVGQHYRAIGIDAPGGIQWIWSGSHADYDKFFA